jgi:hypothetical protein
MTGVFALLTPLLSSGTFITVSRRVVLWYNLDSSLKPALYMQEPEENGLLSMRGTPRRAEWLIHLFIYAEVPVGGDAIGATTLNNLLDAVELALGLQAGQGAPVTLSNSVYRIWQEGIIRKDPGDIDGHALAIYPLRIRPP